MQGDTNRRVFSTLTLLKPTPRLFYSVGEKRLRCRSLCSHDMYQRPLTSYILPILSQPVMTLRELAMDGYGSLHSESRRANTCLRL